MALLRLLAARFEARRVFVIADHEVDLDRIRARHPGTQLFRLNTDLVVVDRQPGRENDVVHAMHGGGGTPETEAFGMDRQRRGR